MKTSTKENLSIVALGVGSAVVLSALGIAAAVYNISDFDKWFGVAWWTLFIFGFLAFGLWDYLKAPRCLAVFLLALAIHLTLLIHFFPENAVRVGWFYLFFAVPEAAAIAAMLFFLGGIRQTERRHLAKRGAGADPDLWGLRSAKLRGVKNGAVQEPQHNGGKRLWSSWRFCSLKDTSIIAKDRLE